ITSTTMTRSWLSAVEWSRSIASVAVATAVSKPKVATVPPTSLSIVLGTPTTGMPVAMSCRAMLRVPSPPIAMSASSRRAPNAATSSSERSRSSQVPSGRCRRHLKGSPRLVVPRMVPPRCVMPRTWAGPRGTTSSSPSRPSKPRRMPRHSHPRCTAARTAPRMTALRPGASPPPVEIAIFTARRRRPALQGASLHQARRGTAPAGDNLVLAGVALIVAAALSRRYGIALPGNGFSSYVVGVMLLAMLDRGWAFAAVVAPFAMFVGDILLRRLPVRAALNNAGHLTVGTTLVGLMYDRMGGQTGAAALTSNNLGLVVLVIVLLPIVVNGTFYLDLALGKTMAWVDARLTLRWETIIYLTSVGLALGWLALTHAAMPSGPTALVAAGLVVATVGSAYVIRLGVHADELRLVQRLAQAIAAEMSLTRSFTRVQELTRQLVPWEQMGFARYDARARQMELLADTAARPDTVFRFDADAGLTGEAVRLHHAVVAHGLAKDQVIVPGAETPGAEMLVPLYHAGQLVGLWSVRHSNPAMYRNSDGELLELLAPQLALMVAIESSLRPVTGASDQTTQYVQTLTATTEEIHASSEEVAAAAQRASHGAGQAATLVSTAAREAGQLKDSAAELAAAGDRTREAGSQMEKTTDRVRTATQDAVRQLTDLGATTEESGREARNVGKAVQDTRRALDRAAQLIERIRGDLSQLVQGSAAWVQDLDRIAEAAAGTARAGKQVAEVGRQNAELAARITESLGQARAGAQTSSQEAEAVAAAAAEQLRAIQDLAHGATELSSLAEQLSQALRFIRGGNGHP